MTEVVSVRNTAVPFPIYGVKYTLIFSMNDIYGRRVSAATGVQSSISKNGNGFSACSSSTTEIPSSSGIYYQEFTDAEMTCDAATFWVKSDTSDDTILIEPRKLGTVYAGTSVSNGIATDKIIIGSDGSNIDNAYAGMLCIATIDGQKEARIIDSYDGATKTCMVVPSWNIAPDNNDTLVIKSMSGTAAPVEQQQIDLSALQGALTDIQSRIPSALATGGNMKASVSAMLPDVITSSVLATSAVTEMANAFAGVPGTEATRVPPADATLIENIAYLVAWFRNPLTVDRSTGAAITRLMNIAGSTQIASNSFSDDGTIGRKTKAT